MTKLLTKLTSLALAVLVGVIAYSSAHASANIVIQNGDPAGVGFNDPTPAAPVGGNTGTTLGQQRLIAFQRAASIWGSMINSGPTITVRATWEELTCDSSSGVLGSAGTQGIWRNFPGAPISNMWYGSALANALAGTDMDPAHAEIVARFNIKLGTPGCIESRQWYLGLDTNHGNNINLVTVLLHEFSHGLGFQTFTNSSSTGAQMQGYPTVYDRFLYDNASGKTWVQMNDSERLASAVNTGNLVWTGPRGITDAASVLTTAGLDAQGRPMLYSPNPVQAGSSVSHWDKAASPNQLMEPSINLNLTQNLTAPYDLTSSLLADVGWFVNAPAPTPTPTPTPTPAPTPAVATVQLSASNYDISEQAPSVSVTVTRSGNTQSVATVDYATADMGQQSKCEPEPPTGLASERCDYQTTVGTLTFAVGQASATINIPVLNDTHIEGTETFVISLRNANGATLGNASATISIVDNDQVSTQNNPIDSFDVFVRQQYLDFLSREPDSGGFGYWLTRLQACAATAGCDIVRERKMVSAGFFYSNEFLLRKGYFIYRFYSASLGRRPTYAEFIPDMASMGQSDTEEEAKRVEFTERWVMRPEFQSRYGGLSNTDFVNRLVDTTGVELDRSALIAALNTGETRARIVRQVAETQPVFERYFKEAFISMQYFGYLRRDPDVGGFTYWMSRLPASRAEIESNPQPYIYDMIGGFVYATEYQLRFGERNY